MMSFTAGQLQDIGRLTSLTSLELHQPNLITDDCARALTALTGLTTLKITNIGRRFTSEGLLALCGLSGLTTLCISGLYSLFTDAVIQAVSRLTSLTTLAMGLSKAASGESIASLRSLVRLTSLELTIFSPGSTFGSCVEFMSRLRALETVFLRTYGPVDVESLRALTNSLPQAKVRVQRMDSRF